MGFKALHTLLWLVAAFTLTTQELVKLNVSPKITAESGKDVTLQCKPSSSGNGLMIEHMEWSQNKTALCSVNSKGNITYSNTKSIKFYCEFKQGQLFLTLQKVKPPEIGNSKRFMCKLRSNKGALHNYTTVEFQEFCGLVEGALKSHGPDCTFHSVYPDGDVHWFHGSHNLSDGSMKHNTTKRVEKGGRLTIHSYLERKSSDVPYNCSLRSTKSGRYIASTLVLVPALGSARVKGSFPHSNGVDSKGPMRTILFISVLLAVTLK